MATRRRSAGPRALLAPQDVDAPVTVLLGIAALGVSVGAYEHAHLFHAGGYSSIHVIGPLFLLNAIGSLIVVLLLLARRPLPFLLGALAISVPSIVALLITHSSSLFGYHEQGFSGFATVTIVAEAVAAVLLLAAAVVGRRALLGPEVVTR